MCHMALNQTIWFELVTGQTAYFVKFFKFITCFATAARSDLYQYRSEASLREDSYSLKLKKKEISLFDIFYKLYKLAKESGFFLLFSVEVLSREVQCAQLQHTFCAGALETESAREHYFISIRYRLPEGVK